MYVNTGYFFAGSKCGGLMIMRTEAHAVVDWGIRELDRGVQRCDFGGELRALRKRSEGMTVGKPRESVSRSSVGVVEAFNRVQHRRGRPR